ncbi:MAG: 4-hydroxythreonine-4-phosphate dehydrogenase PdxA [Synechococcus sp. XM-24]|nr:MAG: 4-hydroxythreonine-4-phosphate dehydrogenase PdxA [Synechococcus sp. XM-24]
MGDPPSDSNAKRPRLIVSLGDPAGIGGEVTLKALARWTPAGQPPLLVGCRRWLEETYTQLKGQTDVPLADPAQLEVVGCPLEQPVKPGTPSAISGEASFRWLTQAVELVQRGSGQALVTAPIAKQHWHAAGHDYPGQTERLAELAGAEEASMLFTARSPQSGWRLNTLLATTHIPLQQVPQALNPERVLAKLDVLLAFCRRFRPEPTLAVAGLNPHAGEAGRLGREERDWLEATLEEWSTRHPEVTLLGPLPPDTCWLSAGMAWQQGGGAPDGFLALYHDQGLIPVKLLAFDQAVNTSLGLPFLRTSPDHGTGFDIAGLGIARAASMVSALEAAEDLG